MKRVGVLAFVWLTLTWASPALAQLSTPFIPNGNYTSLTAGASSANVLLPSGTTVQFQNTGASAVSCSLANSSPAAVATTAQLIIQPGGTKTVGVASGNTWGACIDITGSASNVIVLAGGSGIGSDSSGFGVGGSGGPTSNVNLTQVGGSNVSLGQQVKAASIPVAIASDQTVPVSVAAGQIADGGSITDGTKGDSPASSGTGGSWSIASLLRGILNAVQGPLPAGENHAGSFGGQETRVSSTPTVQNASYVSGNCLGGFNSIAIARVNGGSLILNSVMVKSIGGSVPTITVYVFDSNPSASTCTDKSTFTLNSADADKLVAAPFALSLTAPTGTSTTFAENTNMARMMVAGGSAGSGVTTLYYALVSGTTFTPATTTDIHVSMQADLN